MILTPLQKLTKNVGDLGKFIVAKSFELLPKMQKIAQSGHTAFYSNKRITFCSGFRYLFKPMLSYCYNYTLNVL